METSDTIRGIIEEDGKLLVSFQNHDGYFHVPLTDRALCAKISKAAGSGNIISIIFDRELEIQSILEL